MCMLNAIVKAGLGQFAHVNCIHKVTASAIPSQWNTTRLKPVYKKGDR